MRPIDADILLEQMKTRRNYIGRRSDDVCLVEDAPTIDVRPVKCGIYYIDEDPDEWYGCRNYCASCKSNWLGPVQYCPNCGLKLKLITLSEEKDEQNRCD